MDEDEELILSFLNSDGDVVRFEWHEAEPARLEIQMEGEVRQGVAVACAYLNFNLTLAQAKRLLYWLEVTL